MVYLAGETCRRVFGIRPSMKSSSGYCEADSLEVAVRSRLVRLASDLSGVMSVFERATTGRETGIPGYDRCGQREYDRTGNGSV